LNFKEKIGWIHPEDGADAPKHVAEINNDINLYANLN
jgi:hypothetical protein